MLFHEIFQTCDFTTPNMVISETRGREFHIAVATAAAVATPACAPDYRRRSRHARARAGVTTPSFNLWGVLESLNKHAVDVCGWLCIYYTCICSEKLLYFLSFEPKFIFKVHILRRLQRFDQTSKLVLSLLSSIK